MDLIQNMDWDYYFSYEGKEIYDLKQVESFLQAVENFPDDFNQGKTLALKKECLYQKAKRLLLNLIFQDICQRGVEDHEDIVDKTLQECSTNISDKDGIPKVAFTINHEQFDISTIEWGLVNQLMIKTLEQNVQFDFPRLVKEILYSLQVERR